MVDDFWYHLKTGGIYKVLSSDAKIEATLERAVVYQSETDNSVWIRPHAEFMDGRFIRLKSALLSGRLAMNRLMKQEEI